MQLRDGFHIGVIVVRGFDIAFWPQLPDLRLIKLQRFDRPSVIGGSYLLDGKTEIFAELLRTGVQRRPTSGADSVDSKAKVSSFGQVGSAPKAEQANNRSMTNTKIN